MTESRAWLDQVDSDWRASQLFASNRSNIFYCQEIAKYQQVAEKSIRAIEAILIERGIMRPNQRARFEHYPYHAIRNMISLKISERGLNQQVLKIFSIHNQAEIRDLCLLAPSLPQANELYRRNTEYPFNLSAQWTAPATEGIFTVNEANRFKRIANELHEYAYRVYRA